MLTFYARRIFAPAGVALLLGGFAHAASVYKYIDEDGNVSYSDVRPSSEDVETVRVQPDVPPGLRESAQERMQRMQDLSAELEETRRGDEGTPAQQGPRQPMTLPQTVWPDDRASGRSPYRNLPPRPPVGDRPPGAAPPIERPQRPGGRRPTLNRPVAPQAR